jgi:hypothetical protein
MPTPKKSKGAPVAAEDLALVEKAVAATIRGEAPELHIERKWNNDWRAGTDLVLCHAAFSQHVGVEFWRGSSLPDPTKLLEGTGKNLRHVKVRTSAEARSPAFRRLIRDAVRLDRLEPKRVR